MIKKISFIFLTLILLFILFNTKSVFALDCAYPESLEKSFEKYDSIIYGKVVEIKEESYGKLLTINVEENFKNVREEQILVKEDLTWGESKKGQSYLFFLNEQKEKTFNYEHPLCSPTTSSLSEVEKVRTLSVNQFPEKSESPMPNEKTNSLDTEKENKVEKPTFKDKMKENFKNNKEKFIFLTMIEFCFISYIIYKFIKRKRDKK